MSRIDNSFGYEEWFRNYGEHSLMYLEPKISNDTPLLIKIGRVTRARLL